MWLDGFFVAKNEYEVSIAKDGQSYWLMMVSIGWFIDA